MMTPQKDLPRISVAGGLALALALTAFAPTAQANVYATNIKINGGMTNITVQAGANVTISYILNEPASAGVTIRLFSGATAARTISAAGGAAGAQRGLNTIAWDGKDNNGNNMPGGDYSISITAAAGGYSGWTVTTDDNNAGNYSYFPQGIGVDRNTNSPYYGRVFVGNSYDNTTNGTSPFFGDYVGVQKLNADGSYADEGGFSTGGVGWLDGGFSPWKIRVSDDDQVYVVDEYNYGEVYRFDPVLSTNSMLHVLRADNVNTAELSGMAVVGTGTNTQLWMADDHTFAGLGILTFAVTADGTCATNDTGTTVVANGAGSSLDMAPFAVSLGRGGNIYTVQKVGDSGDPAERVLEFPAYDPATNGGAPELAATWAVGSGNDLYAGSQGLAVDPAGTYVAVACQGLLGSSGYVNGSTTLFYATNGLVVTNIDLGVAIPNERVTDPTHHQDMDADWDAVGNLYYLDAWPGVWRAVSPPGTNQATTVALAVVHVISSVQTPYITGIGVSAGTVTVRFTGAASDPAEMFLLLGASVAQGPYSPVAGALITGSGGNFQATAPVNGPSRFYRVERLATVPPTGPPAITSIGVSAGAVTIHFTGTSSDPAWAFEVLSAPVAQGPYSPVAGALITGSGGSYQAVVPMNGATQFYRIERLATIPLHITGLSVAGGTVTMDITGSPSDPPSALTLLSSPAVNGTYAPAAGATIIQVSPGLFQATVPTNGPSQFYRIRQ